MVSMRFAKRLSSVWLTVNRSCNLRCNWCYTNGNIAPDLSFANACFAVDLIAKYGFKNIILLGGEPTCYEPLTSLIEYISSKNLKGSIITNGIMLENENYTRRLKDVGLESINISIKASSAIKYKKQTGFDGFNKVLRAINVLSKLAINNVVSFVLTEENTSDIIDIVELTKAEGAKRCLVFILLSLPSW